MVLQLVKKNECVSLAKWLSISVCNKSFFEFIIAVASNSAYVSTAGGAGWPVLAGFDLPLVLVFLKAYCNIEGKEASIEKT